MRFDDRLLTVLNQPAEDRHDAAVRWRQLVDLVARAGPNSDSPVVADALEAIRSEAPNVDEALRAAAARAVAALPLPLGLLEYFAADSLSVSAPVLAAATLDPQQWQVLRAAADEETRRFIETLHPGASDRAEYRRRGGGGRRPAETPIQPCRAAPLTRRPSLHEVVERIERRRRHCAGEPVRRVRHRSPCGQIPRAVPLGMRPGRRDRLGRRCAAGAADRPLDRKGAGRRRRPHRPGRHPRLFVRAPFRDGMLRLGGGGPVAGEWKISGVPAFEPADGRFAGYRGVALREVPAAAEPAREPMPDVLTDPASLRELVHEIKTPLNAIIGFAEIIEGQYLGPADRGYRERAAEIVRQARLLLTAIDDLDFAAKVHSASGAARSGSILARCSTAPPPSFATLQRRTAAKSRSRERGPKWPRGSSRSLPTAC